MKTLMQPYVMAGIDSRGPYELELAAFIEQRRQAVRAQIEQAERKTREALERAHEVMT